MFDNAFLGALTLLGAIILIFVEFYPKVRDFIDKAESNYRKDFARLFALSMYDISKECRAVWDAESKQWVSSIPAVQDFEKFAEGLMKKSEEIWKNVPKARKLRDNLDMVIVSFIIGVIAFFIVPLAPTQFLAWAIIITGISATIVGILILFYVAVRLYHK